MKDWFLGFTPNNLVQRSLLFLIFVPPIVVATVNHGISTVYLLLTILALFNCRGGWRQLELLEKQILIGFSVFFIFSAVSMIYSSDPKQGSYFLERYIRLVLIVPAYLMLRMQGFDTSRIFLLGVFVGALVTASQAWYQVVIMNSAAAHGAYHKIILGDMAILFAALIMIAAIFYAKSGWHYCLALTGVAAGGYASFLSYTRASWLFIPIFTVLLIGLFWNKLDKNKLLGICVILVIATLLLFAYPPKKLKDGFSSGLSDITGFAKNPKIETSWGSRLNMWHYSILVFKSSPVLGTGVGSYNSEARKLLDRGDIPESRKNSFSMQQSNAHSIYFQVLAEGGIVGLLIMIVALFILPAFFLYTLWRSTNDRDLRFITLSGLTCIVAFAWFGMSAGWLIRNPPMTFYCMVILIYVSSAANRKYYLDTVSKT